MWVLQELCNDFCEIYTWGEKKELVAEVHFDARRRLHPAEAEAYG